MKIVNLNAILSLVLVSLSSLELMVNSFVIGSNNISNRAIFASSTSRTKLGPEKTRMIHSQLSASDSEEVEKEIAEGVTYDTIAREWRCKWSPDGDKVSLVSTQIALESILEELYEVPGCKRVDRIVCGSCLDFKVVTSVSEDKFGAWEKAGFPPEKDFIDMLNVIGGVSEIETQTYTIMQMEVTPFDEDEDF